MQFSDYCAYCGEEFCEFGLEPEDAFPADDGSLCCCVDCQHERNNELWEARYLSPIPPDYND